MSARRPWGFPGAVVALLLLAGAPAVLAQAVVPPPLEARLVFKDAPADVTFSATSPATPIPMVLQVENTSGAPIETVEGFSRSDFWRLLVFRTPTGGVVVHAPEHHLHRELTVKFCLSRAGVPLRPAAIPVVPTEVLPGPPGQFKIAFEIPDARLLYDLSRPGRYTVRAEIPLLVPGPGDPSAVIVDCDQFAGQRVINIGPGVGRREFTILSNALEFVIAPEPGSLPTTTATASPPPGPSGWNTSDVTVTIDADAGAAGAQVQDIVTALSGAQTGGGRTPGTHAAARIAVDGTTNLTYFARDVAGGEEAPHILAVKIDRTSPELVARCEPGSPKPVITGTDALSGIASVTLLGQGPLSEGGFTEQLTHGFTDVAGNGLVAITGIDAQATRIRFGVLRRNAGSVPTQAPDNEVQCQWQISKAGQLLKLTQSVTLRTGGKVTMDVTGTFSSSTNKTTIVAKSAGSIQQVTRSGLVFLNLRSSPGGFLVDF